MNVPSSEEEKQAALFLRQACQDYAAARCCLINGLFSGFVFAQQAVEKVLKAYIFFSDAKTKWKGAHDIKSAATRVQDLYTSIDLTPHSWIIDRLQTYYIHRYPDVPRSNDGSSSSTEEIHAVDELMVYLSVSFPMKGKLKIASGIFPAVYPEYFGDRGFVLPESHWIKFRNSSVAILLSRLPSAEAFLINNEQHTKKN